MKLTVKHYYSFGRKAEEVGSNLLSENSWDAIRIDDNQETPFSIPKSREDWIKKCLANKEMVGRGKAIGEFATKKGFKKIISFGVGACFMEHSLKTQYPDIALECSDFSPKAVERLKEVFTEAEEIYTFNMLLNDFRSQRDVLHVFHRLDADFSNNQWEEIFKKASLAEVEDILFVPCAIDTVKSLTKTVLGKWYQIIFRRSRLSFAGYLRTKDALKDLFGNYYEIREEVRINDLTGFLLKIKK